MQLKTLSPPSVANREINSCARYRGYSAAESNFIAIDDGLIKDVSLPHDIVARRKIYDVSRAICVTASDRHRPFQMGFRMGSIIICN